MSDIFNNATNVQNVGQIASAQFASIQVGSNITLGQSVRVAYSQQIQTVSVIGSTSVYWIPGTAQGTVDVDAMVGKGGFFAGWRNLDCGRIGAMNINVAGGRCGFSGGAGLKFEGGIVTSVGASIQAGTSSIGHNVSIMIASLSAS